VSDWWSDTRAGAEIVGGWAGSAGHSIGNFFVGGSQYPVNNERAMLAQEGIQQWTQLTKNGDPNGEKLGNPVTAVLKAGPGQAVMILMPGGEEEKAAANVVKEGEKAADAIWSSTKAKTAVKNAYEHWEEHGAEFPEYQNAKQYVEGAKDFFKNPPTGTLTKVRSNGDKLFYNPANNTFGVQAADGTPRTMFRPSAGINYWNKQ
jgi:hypothetical protein